jgi:alpha-1,6-mannosyltransferase
MKWGVGSVADAPVAVRRLWLLALDALARMGASDETSLEGVEAPSNAEVWALLRRPVLLGLLATSAITFGAIHDASGVFSLKVQGAWPLGISITTPPERGLLLALTAFYGGVLLLLRCWLELCAIVRSRPGVPVKALGFVLALWVLPLLIAPPLFSRDVYAYAAQGQMVTQGLNPYMHGPQVLGAGSFLTPVDRLWYNAPAPYGPLFLLADAGLVNVTGHHDLAAVIGLRLMALAGVILFAVFLPSLARSERRDPASVFALAALNPVTLLHLIGGAHNDALMIGFLVAGLAVARKGRPLLGVVLCTLGAAVKVPALIGVVYIGWQWLGPQASRRERIRPVVSAAIVSMGLLTVLSMLTGLGWGWIRALANPGQIRSVLDPATGIGMFLGGIAHLLHLGISATPFISIMRALGDLVAFGSAVALLLASDRLGAVKAIGVSLFLVVVLGPVIQPWYMAWPAVLLAPVVGGRARSVLIGIISVAAFIGFPGGTLILRELLHSNVLEVLLAIGLLSAIVAPPVWLRAKQLLVTRRQVVAVD